MLTGSGGWFRAAEGRILPAIEPNGAAIYAAVLSEWFADTAGIGDGAGILVDEVVMRGAAWLEERWRRGGVVYKHVALARRDPRLTRDEFARRWRAHAGRAGGVVIPDDVRGCAYVQNHPRGDAPFDAITEVYFDTLDGLRRRADWFRAHPPDDPLFTWSVFLAVEEHPGIPGG